MTPAHRRRGRRFDRSRLGAAETLHATMSWRIDDRHPGNRRAPSNQAHLENEPQRANPARARRIQRSRERLRNPMIPGAT